MFKHILWRALQLFLFLTSIRTSVENSTKIFIKVFSNELKKVLSNCGRDTSVPCLLHWTNANFCIANFLHPHYKGYVLKLQESTGRVYDDTISKIEDMCKKLCLHKEESPSQQPVPSQVSIKILSYS
jgi:hypothetical protein